MSFSLIGNMSYKGINNTCLLTWEIAFPANLLNYITLSYDYHIICPDHLINLQSVRHHKESSFNIINHVSFCATFVVILNTTFFKYVFFAVVNLRGIAKKMIDLRW